MSFICLFFIFNGSIRTGPSETWRNIEKQNLSGSLFRINFLEASEIISCIDRKNTRRKSTCSKRKEYFLMYFNDDSFKYLLTLDFNIIRVP